jgi:hypothetical protein
MIYSVPPTRSVSHYYPLLSLLLLLSSRTPELNDGEKIFFSSDTDIMISAVERRKSIMVTNVKKGLDVSSEG